MVAVLASARTVPQLAAVCPQIAARRRVRSCADCSAVLFSSAAGKVAIVGPMARLTAAADRRGGGGGTSPHRKHWRSRVDFLRI
jgi:hypothetical protein